MGKMYWIFKCVDILSEVDSAKVKKQHATYQEAKVKLEDQLLKLKEEREKLKDEGSKHEDKIMRENAKLQVNLTANFFKCS